MKIVTFNVNGLRSLKEDYYTTRKWSFDQLLDSFDADIICLQETKINKSEMVDHDLGFPKGYHAYFAFPRVPRRTGYSGVVTYVKQSCIHQVRSFHDGFARPEILEEPGCSLKRAYDIDTLERLDSEARVMMTDHGAFVLFNVYYPNDGGEERAEFRERFYSALTLRCRDLARAGKNVIVACDLNTTYSLIDHCDYVKPYLELLQAVDKSEIEASQEKFIQSLLEERFNDDGVLLLESLHDIPSSFDINNLRKDVPPLLQEFFMAKTSRIWAYQMFRRESNAMRFTDCYRLFHPDEPNRFTCWNTLMSARGSNYGTRIDYIFGLGPAFADEEGRRRHVRDSDQMYDFMGSDHCPVWTIFNFDPVPWDDAVKPKEQTGKKTGLQKQPRLDSFFKPVKKSLELEPTNNSSSSMPQEETQVTKRIKTLADGKLPFGKPKANAPAPLCPVHREPGKLLTVNKAGPNKGRQFYVCARPVGHPTDRDARCNFFQWHQ